MVSLKKGTRVRHMSKPDWGLGQLLEDANSQDMRIFFTEVGEKVLGSVSADKLQVLTGDDAHSDHLDHLHLPGPGKSRPMRTMAQAKMRFLELFPGGLHGERVQENERGYKDRLVALAQNLFNSGELQNAMDEGRYREILERASRLISTTENNFPASFEKIKFRDAVKTSSRQEAFAHAFCSWVIPVQPEQEAFEALASELSQMGVAKWPIMTSWRFLLHPQTDVLIKPENLRNAAELSRFEINYKPEPNWLTYDSVRRYYRHVREQIADLNPRDMIDVQNFIWCIDPGQYST